MEKKTNYYSLDDSWDGLDDKITKRILKECEEMTMEELIESAKEEGIKNPESMTRNEILKKIEGILNEDE